MDYTDIKEKMEKTINVFSEKLVEVLGHTPFQVFVGAIIGIIVGCIF